MTGEQRERVVHYLGNGAKLREAADMVEAPWADFASCWTTGRKDSEAGRDTDAATFYREARAARSRNLATLRAEAVAAAGSRESADLLAAVRQLESEAEPLAGDDDGPVQPIASLVLDHPDPAVREAARTVQDDCRVLLRVLAGT